MPKITLADDGDSYHGTDPGNDHKRIDLQPGDSVDVSDAKAKQLLADFPDRFKKKASRGGRGGDSPATYDELEGDALRKVATDRKVEFDASAEDAAVRAALVAADKAEAEKP